MSVPRIFPANSFALQHVINKVTGDGAQEYIVSILGFVDLTKLLSYKQFLL